jgi:holo-[acyl-carrier-protein] synthase
MIKGIGIDLIEIRRFEKQRNKEKFLQQFLTRHEILQGRKKRRSDGFYAAIFSLKEGLFKALGCGLSYGSYWQDCEFDQDLRIAALRGFLRNRGRRRSVSRIHAGYTVSKRYAVGIVVIE